MEVLYAGLPLVFAYGLYKREDRKKENEKNEIIFDSFCSYIKKIKKALMNGSKEREVELLDNFIKIKKLLGDKTSKELKKYLQTNTINHYMQFVSLFKNIYNINTNINNSITFVSGIDIKNNFFDFSYILFLFIDFVNSHNINFFEYIHEEQRIELLIIIKSIITELHKIICNNGEIFFKEHIRIFFFGNTKKWLKKKKYRMSKISKRKTKKDKIIEGRDKIIIEKDNENKILLGKLKSYEKNIKITEEQKRTSEQIQLSQQMTIRFYNKLIFTDDFDEIDNIRGLYNDTNYVINYLHTKRREKGYISEPHTMYRLLNRDGDDYIESN